MKTQTRLVDGSKLMMMHKDSLKITKEKPKIRIVHLVAPEIIKTDVENFRELVQRLTGKGSSRRVKKEEKNIISSSMQKSQANKNTLLHKTDANTNAFLSFFGDGFMHGMKNNNIHEFPLLPFRSNSQENTCPSAPCL